VSAIAVVLPCPKWKCAVSLAACRPRSVESPNREFGKDLVSTKPSYETSGMNSGVRTGSKTVRKINLDARDGGVPVLVRHKSVDDWYISKLDCMLYSAMFVHVHPKKQV
jgi:hypothetical protein